LLGHVTAHGRLPDDAGLPAQLAAVLATATQIAPSGHLAMAAAVQACKGVTVYVDGSRQAQPKAL
jgi:ribonucleoside-diphosphate reductase alpha chain